MENFAKFKVSKKTIFVLTVYSRTYLYIAIFYCECYNTPSMLLLISEVVSPLSEFNIYSQSIVGHFLFIYLMYKE